MSCADGNLYIEKVGNEKNINVNDNVANRCIVLNLLEDIDFKKKLIKCLNDSIDIPIINEKTEEKIIESIYNVIVNVIKNE